MKSKKVLFVDDEEYLLASLKIGLMDEPYKCLFANSGSEALKVLSATRVHLIVTDMRMPGMSGLELLRIVREKYPNVIRIVLSGYTQITTLLTAINDGHIYKYIPKPWKLEEEFKPSIRDALEYYDKQNASHEVAVSASPETI
jgi:two-component system, NtrC family, response regulator HupR/HoxA